MNYFSFLFCILLILSACQEPASTPSPSTKIETKASLPEVDTSLYETFEIEEGDTTYLMKKYFMVHLIKGEQRDQDEASAAKIQEGHMAHLGKLAEEKIICIAGPMDADSEILGIAIYSVPSLEIADSLANADPAVQAGRLKVEVLPFWAAVGSQLF